MINRDIGLVQGPCIEACQKHVDSCVCSYCVIFQSCQFDSCKYTTRSSFALIICQALASVEAHQK